MSNTITITRENLINVYNTASAEQKEFLESIFGKDTFQPQDIKEKVKTLEDAILVLGNDNKAVLDYYAAVNAGLSNDIIAFAKLKVIAEALNGGWKPKFSKGECRYYTLYNIYSKDEYDNLSEEEKEGCHVIDADHPISCMYAGPVYAYAYSTVSNLRVDNSSNLAFKTQELAEYCGNQFLYIWMDLLFA